MPAAALRRGSGPCSPNVCPVPPSPNGGHDPLRPDHFGGGTGTSVSLHREPRPSEVSVPPLSTACNRNLREMKRSRTSADALRSRQNAPARAQVRPGGLVLLVPASFAASGRRRASSNGTAPRPRSAFFSSLPAGLRGSGSSVNSTISGHLEAREVRGDVARARPLRVERRARHAAHDRLHALAELGVGHADDRGLVDLGMIREAVLDLGAVHVLAAADDHVLRAVDDEVEALRVAVAEVAGVQPAVAHGLGGGVGAVPVARRDRRAVDQRARRAGRRGAPCRRRRRSSGRGSAAAARPRSCARAVLAAVHGGDAVRLGEPVGVREARLDRAAPRAPSRSSRAASARRRTRCRAGSRGRSRGPSGGARRGAAWSGSRPRS